MKKELTAADCLRPFDNSVLAALEAAEVSEKMQLSSYGDLGKFVISKLPASYRNGMDTEALHHAVLLSITRLSDLDLVTADCTVTGKPHRKVPEIHFPETPEVSQLPPLEQWVYEMIASKQVKMDDENVFQMLSERLPQYLVADLCYAADELGRAWMRLALNGYFGEHFTNAALDEVEARAT